jgi:hypothetical protein
MYGLRLLLRSVFRLLVAVKVVPSSRILVALMMDAIRSSERSDLIRTAGRNISEHGILQLGYIFTPPYTFMMYCLII